jgi:hypothetical protein
MGEMADMYDAYDEDCDDDSYGPQNRFDQFRDDTWQTKGNKQLSIGAMSDKHLLAAFKMFGHEKLRDEMLIRMFEEMTKPKIHF